MILLKTNLRGTYSNRKFWNDLCIFRQASTIGSNGYFNEYPFFESAIAYMSQSVKLDPLNDIYTDKLALLQFRFLIVSMIDLSGNIPDEGSAVLTVEYWDDRVTYPTLVSIYNREVTLWNDHLHSDISGVVDILARSYLAMIMNYLSYLNLNTPQLLREVEIMYAKLTNYDHRYNRYISPNLHTNLLCQADSLFLHHYV